MTRFMDMALFGQTGIAPRQTNTTDRGPSERFFQFKTVTAGPIRPAFLRAQWVYFIF